MSTATIAKAASKVQKKATTTADEAPRTRGRKPKLDADGNRIVSERKPPRPATDVLRDYRLRLAAMEAAHETRVLNLSRRIEALEAKRPVSVTQDEVRETVAALGGGDAALAKSKIQAEIKRLKAISAQADLVLDNDALETEAPEAE